VGGVDALEAFRITGMDQFNVLTPGTAEKIRAETHRLFEGYGPDGGSCRTTSSSPAMVRK
jgi:hypothetical protein